VRRQMHGGFSFQWSGVTYVAGTHEENRCGRH
jgi:hypothetical protein